VGSFGNACAGVIDATPVRDRPQEARSERYDQRCGRADHIYYLDSGAPEPIRSALLKSAVVVAAFEAAGFRNAWRVEMLPAGADPMDVRFNVIQWVHRSTRGWSYGESITDPRTGEIIKGQVTLGSLPVRQDCQIAQGLIAKYEEGRTLGLQHNFAASTNHRASVIDYPPPHVRLNAGGEMDLSNAYAKGIGECHLSAGSNTADELKKYGGCAQWLFGCKNSLRRAHEHAVEALLGTLNPAALRRPGGS